MASMWRLRLVARRRRLLTVQLLLEMQRWRHHLRPTTAVHMRGLLLLLLRRHITTTNIGARRSDRVLLVRGKSAGSIGMRMLLLLLMVVRWWLHHVRRRRSIEAVLLRLLVHRWRSAGTVGVRQIRVPAVVVTRIRPVAVRLLLLISAAEILLLRLLLLLMLSTVITATTTRSTTATRAAPTPLYTPSAAATLESGPRQLMHRLLLLLLLPPATLTRAARQRLTRLRHRSAVPLTLLTLGRLGSVRTTIAIGAAVRRLLATAHFTRVALLFVVRVLHATCRRLYIVLPAGVAALLSHQIAENHECRVLGARRHKHRRADRQAACHNLLVAVETHAVQGLGDLAEHVEDASERGGAFVQEEHRLQVERCGARHRVDKHCTM